jgi:hypothetical protein
MPTLLWVAIVLPLGAILAFLSLEGIGIPLVFVALGLIVYVTRRTGNRSVVVMSFGVGFLLSVSFFAIVTSRIFRGEADPFATEWFAAHFAFGVAVIVMGWILRPRDAYRGNV